ncbi:hypothetical protein BJV78DRAFT_112384 [Lactifluus subvellereus]|nr:hypothetical protein BJV78DRAFT_112384 [Lactifluus subvellereus]
MSRYCTHLLVLLLFFHQPFRNSLSPVGFVPSPCSCLSSHPHTTFSFFHGPSEHGERGVCHALLHVQPCRREMCQWLCHRVCCQIISIIPGSERPQ